MPELPEGRKAGWGRAIGLSHGADLELNVFLWTSCPDRKPHTHRCSCLSKGLAQAEGAGPGAGSLKESGMQQCSELHTHLLTHHCQNESTLRHAVHTHSHGGLTCTFPTRFDAHLCLPHACAHSHTPLEHTHPHHALPCTPTCSMPGIHTPCAYAPPSMCQAVCSREHGDALQQP